MNSEWMLLPQRLAVHVPTRTGVIADVHLGYSEARRKCGDAIPVRSPAEPWLPLAAAKTRFAFERLVIAGDLFEQAVDFGLAGRFLAFLQSIEVTLAAIVPGNHDRGWRTFADRLPFVSDPVELGSWRVVHEASPHERQAIQGHHHPAWSLGGRRIPCFLVTPHRMVLPAFSLDAAGGNVAGQARWRGYHAYACDGDSIRDMGIIGSNSDGRPRRLLGRR
ncbi:MAG: hypothetical protein U0744_21630 [Gemmataceae bacterium]